MRIVLYSIIQAISSFWRRSFITFLSIVTITIALMILGGFMMVTINLKTALGNLQRQVELEFYLDNGLTKADVSTLYNNIESEEGVESVEFVTAERARIEFIDEYGEDLLEGLPINPFPPSIRIELKKSFSMGDAVSNLGEKYSDHDFIQQISAPNLIAYKLEKISRIFLILTFAWGFILIIAATVIITNTIRLAIAQRANSIHIMQLVGASRGFVRTPFQLEGFLHGGLSGVFAWLILFGITEVSYYIFPGIIPLPLSLNIVLVILGSFFGLLGSSIALRRYLRY